ncbi:MAG: hypothetical protein AAGK22_26640 [Acidobacteriota bacterium]
MTAEGKLPAHRVLVTVGTLCSVSSVGTTETHRAVVNEDPSALGFAAFDAGYVGIEGGTVDSPAFVRSSDGSAIDLATIEAEWGAALRSNMGIRRLPEERVASHVPCDVAAPLPHDLESGGLRRLAGLGFRNIRQSGLSDMFGLFDDDPRLGPSLQAQLFLYGGIGALAALPRPLSQMLPEPHRFRVAAGSAFPGMDSHHAMSLGMQPKRELVEDKKNDRLAFRLAASLSTHGPALVSAFLAPAISLSRVRRKPEILEALVQPGCYKRVPQAPMVASAACASALVGLSDVATQMVSDYPGLVPPQCVLWTAADAGLLPDARILEAFGLGAMMHSDKLAEINEGRPAADQRPLNKSLAPFDIDAQGTVVGHGGSGVVVTTLEFALEHRLDITSLIVGWAQSGETGGKGHFAGVGFGGENALIGALEMAHAAHGYGVQDFGHVVAHATGTRTNSRTELSNLHFARTAVAAKQGLNERLRDVTIGAPKSVGDGHTMGETGLKAAGEAIRYVLGEKTVGVPTLRSLDPDLGDPAEFVKIGAAPVEGNPDGGALVPTQGFGGYDGAVALRSATPEALRRYGVSEEVLESYLERWPEIRRDRVEREARLRRTRGFVLQLADEHRWAGAS